MNNYHYIVSSLPVLAQDYKFSAETPESILADIREQLSARDNVLVDLLYRGFDPESLTAEFYREALSGRNTFLRGYFSFDLNVRNAKVSYLNRQLGRPALKDVMDINSDEDAEAVETGDFEEAPEVDAVLYGDDLLARERGIDDLYWKKIDSLTTFDYFDVEAVLGFLAKLQIVARWFRLDEAAGRELFKKLVNEVRGTFKGVEYDGNN